MADIQTVIKNELTWFQKHERLILGLCLLCTVLWLGNKWLDNNAVAAKTALGVAQAESDKTRVQADLSAKNYQMTIDALTKQNSSLAAAVATRQTVTEKKVKDVLDPKPLTDVLTDLQAAYRDEIDFDGTTITGNSLTFGLPIVQKFTATKIERDAAQADVADLNVIVKNQVTELAAADDVIKKKDAEIAATETTHKAEIASVKANAAKSKRNWFVAGFIAGFCTRFLH